MSEKGSEPENVENCKNHKKSHEWNEKQIRLREGMRKRERWKINLQVLLSHFRIIKNSRKRGVQFEWECEEVIMCVCEIFGRERRCWLTAISDKFEFNFPLLRGFWISRICIFTIFIAMLEVKWIIEIDEISLSFRFRKTNEGLWPSFNRDE